MWLNEQEKEWLRTLKVGDEAVIKGGHGFNGPNYTITKVVRITKAQVVVTSYDRPDYEQKFWLKNGEQVGRDSYHFIYLIPRSKKVDAELKRQNIIYKFNGAVHWLQSQKNHLSIEDKENIADFITEFSKRLEEKEQKRLDVLAELQKEGQEMGLYDGDKPNAEV